MELTAREDIEAPQDRVFAMMSDFDTIERQAMRRGVEVSRTAEGPGAGMAWDTGFRFRGKRRQAQVTLTEYQPSERLVFTSVSGGLTMVLTLDIVALSPGRTRINATTTMSAKTLSARLFLQSMKLARGGMDKRFRKGVAELAGAMETRLRGAA
ncbi:SRPBCC family protein [Mameliella sediminis]|uniref:SRPBCC family protein n=1 Tax=Mameliella sediminis TaxID=2836866 RepID=UPI001C4854B7|nr:SRPBCC family protein [Mameliella sediminis]MBV7396016.1 SRPBCC family protein [Mameliella sediminis]MBY6160427.1 SRPBCC family protein [Mameliella alba]MBY6168897.1 SRPBCC family protein [Mameliella alba]MBY6173882.1 SRPBCC family protein [Mameliella alba]